MKRLSLPLFLFFSGIGLKIGFSQNCSGFGSVFSGDSLYRYLQVLASDSLEGREAGQPGQRKAAHYLARHFGRLGCEPAGNDGFFQTFRLRQERIAKKNVSVGGIPWNFLKEYYHWPGLPALKLEKKEIVFAGYGIRDEDSGYDNFMGYNVEGQVVMVLQDEPMLANGFSAITGKEKLSDWSRSSRKKTDFLKSQRPAAILMVARFFSDDLEKWGHYLEKTRIAREDKTFKYDDVPVLYIHPDQAEEILQRGGIASIDQWKEKYSKKKKTPCVKIPVEFSMEVAYKDTLLPTENVVAWWPGTDLSQEHVILTAHYDHLGKNAEGTFYGADDDGSGTAALMEIARVLRWAADKGVRPRRSILIMPVTAEEKGLLGSAYYTDYPRKPLSDAVANLNIDMVGRRDARHAEGGDYVYIIGSHFLSQELHDINEEANAGCAGLELDYSFNTLEDPNRLYFRSDHYNFALHKIPCIFYFSGLHEDYHATTDTAEKIDFSLLTRRTRLVFETLWRLANRKDRPALN
ncbi:MAG: M28 family peptidase [Flavobacteriales bacterium]|nr:M28 family peptidase [Flavobacteriales bacterium]MDW8432705.1 M28 family peptidase [Flavobacteriales bacterium]